MNKKINWFDVSADFISGTIRGIIGFVVFFFLLNLWNFWFPVGTNAPTVFQGIILGIWLGYHTLRKNNALLIGLCVSVILLTLVYNAIVTKIITLPFNLVEVTVFINSFMIGVIVITAVDARIIIKQNKTEPVEKNTTTN